MADPYFTVAEFRARYPDLTIANGYTDAKITEYRDLAEQAFEHAAGVAFVPRQATTTVNNRSSTVALVLPPQLRTVTAGSVDGVALTASELADLVADPAGVLYRSTTSSGWTRSKITVTYQHGYDAPPLRVKAAVMLLAKTWMVRGPVDDRATQIATDGATINLATPGVRGSWTGVPEVDATIDDYAVRAYVG